MSLRHDHEHRSRSGMAMTHVQGKMRRKDGEAKYNYSPKFERWFRNKRKIAWCYAYHQRNSNVLNLRVCRWIKPTPHPHEAHAGYKIRHSLSEARPILQIHVKYNCETLESAMMRNVVDFINMEGNPDNAAEGASAHHEPVTLSSYQGSKTAGNFRQR